jgi:hypothetical protein
MDETPIESNHGLGDMLSINLEKVLNAAPTLKHSPDLALAIANAGGDVENNAQAVGALQLIHHIAATVHEHSINSPQMYSEMIRHAQKMHGEAE